MVTESCVHFALKKHTEQRVNCALVNILFVSRSSYPQLLIWVLTIDSIKTHHSEKIDSLKSKENVFQFGDEMMIRIILSDVEVIEPSTYPT